MTLKSHARIGLRHTATVVDDLYGRTSGIDHDDMDMTGTGIDGILHQLLDDGSRSLDDLASSNLVGDGIREEVDNVHGATLVNSE